MPVDVYDVIEVLATLCEEKHLVACFSGSLKGGIVTGVSALLGGMLLGPVGLAVGGAIGGCASAAASSGKFQPAAVVIRNMSDAQKKALYSKAKYAFRNFGIQDVAMMSALLMSNSELKEVAFGVVKDFLKTDMHMSIKQ